MNNSVLCIYSELGTFLGLGTVTGSVAVYVTFSLQVKNIMDQDQTNITTLLPNGLTFLSFFFHL